MSSSLYDHGILQGGEKVSFPSVWDIQLQSNGSGYRSGHRCAVNTCHDILILLCGCELCIRRALSSTSAGLAVIDNSPPTALVGTSKVQLEASRVRPPKPDAVSYTSMFKA